jgi:hypothetical protein
LANKIRSEQKLNQEEQSLLDQAKNLTIGDSAPGPMMKEEVKLVNDPNFIKDIIDQLDLDENDQMIQELLNQIPQEGQG